MNIQGLRNKTYELIAEINNINPAFIFLNEHNLTIDQIELLNLPKYKLVSSFCRKEHKGGGSAIYIRQDLNVNVTTIDFDEYNKESVQEFSTATFTLQKTKFILIAAYRPPISTNCKQEFIDSLDTILQRLMTKRNTRLIVLGDMNMDLTQQNQTTKNLRNMLRQHGVTILDSGPTRVTPQTSTKIDHGYSNRKQDKLGILKTTISDHFGLILHTNISIPKLKNTKLTIRQTSQSNIETLKKQLKVVDWKYVLNLQSTEEKYTSFLNTFQTLYKTSCPEKTIDVNPNRSPIEAKPNMQLDQLKERLNKQQDKFFTTNSIQDKNLFIEYKKNYEDALNHTKKENFTNYIKKHDNTNKAIWKAINAERNKNNQPREKSLTLTENGKTISDPKTVAQTFNNFFINIGKRDHSQINNTPLNMIDHRTQTNFSSFSKIDTKHLIRYINQLKSKTSSGIDGISNKIIKACKQEIAIPLVDIINSSLDTGIIPKKLKISIVTPKLKKGGKHNKENYRPISILSSFSKILEKIVHEEITTYLNQINFFHPNQHGFLKGKTTTTAVTYLVKIILGKWEQKNSVTGVFVDLQKAFDCINWEILLKKLEILGFKNATLNWISNYFDDRRQITEISTTISNSIIRTKSKPALIKRGVPQGSILGPLFFLIYINDCPNYLPIDSKSLMYADDTTLIIPNHPNEDRQAKVSATLNSAIEIFDTIDLQVNKQKTSIIHFTQNENDLNQPKGNLSYKQNTKFLGLTIDSKLDWTPHIQLLEKKLSSAIFVIGRVRRLGGEKTSILCYHSLFGAHLSYGITLWGGTTKTNKLKIQILQKKAIRQIKQSRKHEHCQHIFIELRIMTVFALYIFQTIIYAKEHQFTHIEDLHNYNTRNKKNFPSIQHRLKRSESNPEYAGAKFFNFLPTELKQIEDLNKFKLNLKSYLLMRPYYSIDEFFEEHHANCSLPPQIG